MSLGRGNSDKRRERANVTRIFFKKQVNIYYRKKKNRIASGPGKKLPLVSLTAT